MADSDVRNQCLTGGLDPHVLSIEHVDVVTAKADADSRNPTIIVQFQCQQINCIRNKGGEVIEV